MSMAGHLDLVPGSRAAKAVAGTVVVALVLGAAAWLGGSYLGWFTRDLVVEARLPVSGDSLGVNSDVKFRGLCEGRGYPVLRIGVTENSGQLEVQDVFSYTADELRAMSTETLPKHFGPTVAEPA